MALSIGSSACRSPIPRRARLAAATCRICTSRRRQSRSRPSSATGSHRRAPCSAAGPASPGVRPIASEASLAAVAFRHLDKSFGAVAALTDVTFSIEAGEAHAIVGENGAGKSTLLKILAGTLRPDRGAVHIDGSPIVLAGPRDALARGIGLVHQEMLAFPNLSVAANIFAGREIVGRFGRLREGDMRARARDLLARLHVPIPPDA